MPVPVYPQGHPETQKVHDLALHLGRVYSGQGAVLWLLASNTDLGYDAPINAWQDGRQADVLTLAARMSEGTPS